MALIAPKLCAYCLEPFTPVKPTQQFCRNRCKARAIGYRLKGIKPQQACAAKAATRRARLARMTQDRFGSLTAREEALLQFGLTVGYRQGYNVASGQARVTQRTAA
jgi:hypothetical protein